MEHSTQPTGHHMQCYAAWCLPGVSSEKEKRERETTATDGIM